MTAVGLGLDTVELLISYVAIYGQIPAGISGGPLGILLERVLTDGGETAVSLITASVNTGNDFIVGNSYIDERTNELVNGQASIVEALELLAERGGTCTTNIRRGMGTMGQQLKRRSNFMVLLFFSILGLFVFVYVEYSSITNRIQLWQVEYILDIDLSSRVDEVRIGTYKHKPFMDEFYYETYFIKIPNNNINIEQLIDDLNVQAFIDTGSILPKWGLFGSILVRDENIDWWIEPNSDKLYVRLNTEQQVYLQIENDSIYIYLERSSFGSR